MNKPEIQVGLDQIKQQAVRVSLGAHAAALTRRTVDWGPWSSQVSPAQDLREMSHYANLQMRLEQKGTKY